MQNHINILGNGLIYIVLHNYFKYFSNIESVSLTLVQYVWYQTMMLDVDLLEIMLLYYTTMLDIGLTLV